MEPNTVDTSLLIRNRSIRRRLGVCVDDEAVGDRLHHVAMAHPHAELVVEPCDQTLVREFADRRCAVLSVIRLAHLPAQQLAGQLQPITDPQNRDAEFIDPSADRRCAFIGPSSAPAEDNRASTKRLIRARYGRAISAYTSSSYSRSCTENQIEDQGAIARQLFVGLSRTYSKR